MPIVQNVISCTNSQGVLNEIVSVQQLYIRRLENYPIMKLKRHIKSRAKNCMKKKKLKFIYMSYYILYQMSI